MKILILNLNQEDLPRKAIEIIGRELKKNIRITILDLMEWPILFVGGGRITRKPLSEYLSASVATGIRQWIEAMTESFGNTRLQNGILLKNLFEYGGFSLWPGFKYDLQQNLYAHLGYLPVINQILEFETPQKVILIYGKESIVRNETVCQLLRLRRLPYLEIRKPKFSFVKQKARQAVLESSVFVNTRLESSRKEKPPDRKKLFAMGFAMRTEFELVSPILRELGPRGYAAELILCHGLGEKTKDLVRQAEAAEIPQKFILGNEGPDSRKYGAGEMRRLERFFLKANPDKLLKKDCDYYGVSLWDVIKSVVFNQLSRQRFFEAVKYFEACKKLLEIEKPSAVFVPGDQTLIQRVCCHAARQCGVKITAVPHYFEQLPGPDFFWGEFLADEWMVLNRSFKKFLAESGVEDSKITLTGLSKFNPLFDRKPDVNYKAVLKKLGVDGRAFTGLFSLTLQGFPEDELMIQSMCSAMKEFPEKILIVRPHPFSEDKSELHVKNSADKNIVITRDLKFEELARASDLLITLTSITGFEAILLDKPVVILNLTSRFYPYPFISEGAVAEINKVSDIVPVLRKILSDPLTQQTLAVGRKKVIADCRSLWGWDAGKLDERLSASPEKTISGKPA